ncbi:polo like kinase 5 (inactive) [Phyllostomus discolor]|uniref:Polo like kinase 5 (Inactive) n=1 Tax=Phyllostomus discolor TaxID=89673 RepID=A0A833ZFV9_9CHIR|nr:polo like kinase 5 (inactive) [Phyllostomus discolor]
MEVKIGDLGLAAKVGPGGRCHRVLCGTPNFLAPEVVSRNGHSCQSDIWALGCVTLPYQREGLPSLRSQSTYSTKGPSRVTQLGLRGAQCRRWKRPLETCSSAWTLGLQVSCSGDQVQLVLCGGGEELLLTVWERGQPHTSYTLGMLRSHGCPPAARHHLLHALRMLQSI